MLVLLEMKKEIKLGKYIFSHLLMHLSQKVYLIMNFNVEFQTWVIFNQINIIFHQDIKMF